MFSRISRYRKLPDEVTTDAQGRCLQAKILRLLPDVPGDFLHTVEEGDRLDHLAYKYYRQPRKWWRMCDANPAFMSPQALLGQESLVTDRFPLTWDDGAGPPPWAALRGALGRKVGVHHLQIEEGVQLVPEVQTIDGHEVTIQAEHYQRAMVVTYNSSNASAEALAEQASTVGFDVGQQTRIGQVGKSIVIPPNVIG
jgi:hypothetical protein